jgi:hypothetical protein
MARAAVIAYHESAQQLISCISLAPVIVRGHDIPRDRIYELIVGHDTPFRAGAAQPIAAWIRQRFIVVPPDGSNTDQGWQVEVTSSMYAILGTDGAEMLAYHWHPEGVSPVTTPHLHLGSASGATWPRLQGAHLPTGFVTLAAFVRCLIEELGVEPRRPDWQAALAVAGA